ncbi:STAS domain-containing protein [Simkania negevensis]|uniref:Anti-sigma factor antagonist n=1 Tax=Simkania negevensis TaxID=83561 RepID=A0ABS3ATD6_9BACT|nr:STAS domain-containing protein [Simkania negevensis]
MKIGESYEVGQALVLRLEGRFDAVAVPMIEKVINGQIARGKKRIIINFDHIDYLSSAGMRLLLSAMKKLNSEGGKLAICSVIDEVHEVIKMAGFHSVLTIYDDEQKAVRAFE